VTSLPSTRAAWPPAVELCVEDLAGVRLAERSGLARIELCSALAEGGLTASSGAITHVLAEVRTIGVQVLIRPRPGHFRFDDNEVTVMERDIAAVTAMDTHPGVTVGFTLGALKDDDELDHDTLRRLLDACGGAPTTLHRCVDQTPSVEQAVEDAAQLGFTKVLTSGGAATAIEGATILKHLVRLAGEEITILAAGSVRAGNIRALVAHSGVRDVHLSVRRVQAEHHCGRRPPSLLGHPTPLNAAPRPDADVVRQLLAELERTAPEAS